MECLRSFRRGDGETSLKGRVERSLDPPEANAARPTPWTLQAMLASAFFCRGPPSADDDDVHVPPHASASGPRKPGMRRPPSASSLPDIPESGVGDPAGADDAASADAVEVFLPDDSPSRRPPAGAAGGEPARKLSHRRSWSWSMQWSAGEPSAKARRKHESGERGTRAPAEADAADEDGFSDVLSERRREDDDDERDDDGNEDVSAAGSSTNAARDDLGRSRPSHSRSGSWSDWASVSASAWFASKTPEEREEARRARAEKMEKKARDLADAEALRARAAEENDQLDRVMRESKRLHEDSLPLKTRSRDGAAACVLVTPPPKNARRRRTRGEAGDEAVDEAIDDDENESDDDDDDDDALGADGVDAGEWVDVELRGVPSRWATRATASASEASQTNYSYAQSHASGPETSGEDEKRRKIRARAFFATLDQRGARGEGSCALFCVALVEWLAANPGLLPTEETRTILPSTSSSYPERDGRDGVETERQRNVGTTSPPLRFALDLIVTGAAREWRRLCSDASLVARFPDKHLDLDTAAALHAPFSVEAETRACVADAEAGENAASVRERLSDFSNAEALEKSKTKTKTKPKTKRLLRAKIHHGKSFVGFLRPPGVKKGDSPVLDALAEAAPPLCAIVRELAASPAPTCSYAVSWNDHFFLLHFRREAGETVAYVMDSLGERLCEGCRRAYVLRFDGDSLSSRDGQSATGRREDEAPAEEPADAAAAAAAFIGDVLPSRALRDLGARILAKDAEDPDPETLMRRLQIEFHRVEAERA